MVNELFRILGLSEKEEEIYYLLLKQGPTTVADISKKTLLNRTFCYDLIDKMIKKGVLLQEKSPKKLFRAVSTDQLRVLVEKKHMESKKEIESLEEIKKVERSKTEILEFKGHYAVFNLFRRILAQKDEVNSFWSKKVGYLFQEFFEENVKVRINKKISLKVLTDDDEWTKKWLKNLKTQKNKYRQIKYLKDFDFDSTIYIYNGEVAIITYENNEPYGLVIKNKEYYETQKKAFERLWKLV